METTGKLVRTRPESRPAAHACETQGCLHSPLPPNRWRTAPRESTSLAMLYYSSHILVIMSLYILVHILILIMVYSSTSSE